MKDNLWNIYNKIDPDFKAGDLVLNINVTAATGSKAKVVTQESNLNIRKGPGTDQPIVGKAAHNELVTVLNQTNQQWWLIKTVELKVMYTRNTLLQLNHQILVQLKVLPR